MKSFVRPLEGQSLKIADAVAETTQYSDHFKTRWGFKAVVSVSVVIPVFNGGALLAETLQSTLGQTLSPEIIVVDDGSTDDTAQTVRSFPTVRYHQVPNGGAGRARNAGVALAQGEWTAFCDADDLWRPAYLETVARTLEPNSKYGFANWVDVLEE